MKYGFVYIWRDRKHNRYYIGSHWGFEVDGYICSSPWMNSSHKRRPADFKRRILSRVYTNQQDLLDKENLWLKLIRKEELGLRYFNLKNQDFGHWCADKDLAHTTKQRISIKTKEAMAKPEVREKYLEGYHKADKRSSDLLVRQKRSKSMKKTMSQKFPVENRYVKLTEEQRLEYYSNKAKQMHSTMSEEKKKLRIEKIVKANIGKKMRLGHKNSPEHERKKIESYKKTCEKKRKELLEKRTPLVMKTMHLNVSQASRELGIGRADITKIRKIINIT